MAYLLHQLVTEAAVEAGDIEALRWRGASLTYGELDRASNGLARALIEGGLRPGDRVAIRLGKGFEQWIAVYGAMRAGGVFVPVDPSLPGGRAARILADCSVGALVTSAAFPALPAPWDGSGPVLTVLVDDGVGPSGLPPGAIAFESVTRDPAAADPQVPLIDLDLAWITYTSGSTGQPKGVALSHRAVLTFAQQLGDITQARPGERVSGFTPIHFSLAIWDLFPSMLRKATVVLVPEEKGIAAGPLERLIREERIAVWCSVPSALRMLLMGGLRERPFPDLRQLWFAGEVFPVTDLAELRRRIPDVEFIHMYGGSETMGRMFHQVDHIPLERPTVPVGRPFPNAEAIVLRGGTTPAGVDEVGELFMRSSMLMRGYWGDAAKTAAVLIPNPLGPEPADLICATGDLVRLRSDGLYEFVGRTDDQIKLRGVRIELGDVDAALNAHPDVADAAAVAVAAPHDVAGKAIVACVVRLPGRTVSDSELGRHVRSHLPSYMAPSRIVFVDRLPRNSSGKIDRPGLREIVAALPEGT